MTKVLIDGDCRLADVISAYPNVLLTLERFGITLGFGEKTIAQVCQRSGVSTSFFLLICNVQAFDDYVPSRATMNSTDMSGLVDYLMRSHSYYLEKRLPHIAGHITRIAQLLPEGHVREPFVAFFNLYRNEVETHFHHEEKHVFPHILRSQRGEQHSSYSVDDFISIHGNLQDKLDDLTQIIFKYLPASVTTDDTIDAVFDILQLSQDLQKHNVVEEKIMVPYVKHIERQRE